MKLRNVLSLLAGFLTIALLSSVFAGIQGAFYPQAVGLLSHPSPTKVETLQLVLKLTYVAVSCVLGGMLTTWISNNRYATLTVGGLIVLVIGWLWVQTIYPFWFWAVLITAVIPCVMLGYTVLKKLTLSSGKAITKRSV